MDGGSDSATNHAEWPIFSEDSCTLRFSFITTVFGAMRERKNRFHASQLQILDLLAPEHEACIFCSASYSPLKFRYVFKGGLPLMPSLGISFVGIWVKA